MDWLERAGWVFLVVLLLARCCHNEQIDNYLYCRAICESQGGFIEMVIYDENSGSLMCECNPGCGQEVHYDYLRYLPN